MLIINLSDYDEDMILSVLQDYCKLWKIRARSLSHGHVNLAIEVDTEKPAKLLKTLEDKESVLSVSLVEHDGDITA